MPGHLSFETPETETVQNFVRTGHFGSEAPLTLYRRGIDGKFYSGHELGANIIHLPIAYLSVALSRPAVPFKRVFGLLSGTAGVSVFAITFTLCLSLVARLGVPVAFAGWRLFVLMVCGQYLIYALQLPDVSLSCPFFAAAALMWVRIESGDAGRYAWLVLGVCLGVLCFIKVTNGIFVIVAAVWIAVRLIRKPRPARIDVVFFGIGWLPGAGAIAWWNWVRSGSIFGTLYEPWETASSASLQTFVNHFCATFVSPGLGLLAYSPYLIALAPFLLRRQSGLRNSLALLVIGSLLLTSIRLSLNPFWNGQHGWGIRYYVPWLPLLAVLGVAIWWDRKSASRWKMLLGALLIAGLAINASVVVGNWLYDLSHCGFEPWSFSTLNTCAVEAAPRNVLRTLGVAIPEVSVEEGSDTNRFVSNRLNVWWFAARTLGVPPALSWSIGFALCLLVIVAARQVQRQAKRDEA
ncbi:MAG: hypothetical protein LAP39_12460 [Acidobacteriia bacterium]|nr:hypothetical protein [Terriglobia bacterium]